MNKINTLKELYTELMDYDNYYIAIGGNAVEFGLEQKPEMVKDTLFLKDDRVDLAIESDKVEAIEADTQGTFVIHLNMSKLRSITITATKSNPAAEENKLKHLYNLLLQFESYEVIIGDMDNVCMEFTTAPRYEVAKPEDLEYTEDCMICSEDTYSLELYKSDIESIEEQSEGVYWVEVASGFNIITITGKKKAEV